MVDIMASSETFNELNEELSNTDENMINVDHLPKSAREIYFVLRENGALKPQEIGHIEQSDHKICPQDPR
jgi:hypothetical protein